MLPVKVSIEVQARQFVPPVGNLHAFGIRRIRIKSANASRVGVIHHRDDQEGDHQSRYYDWRNEPGRVLYTFSSNRIHRFTPYCFSASRRDAT
jgi:hypothetical protein